MRDGHGRTALYFAALNGESAIVGFLLDSRATPEPRDLDAAVTTSPEVRVQAAFRMTHEQLARRLRGDK